MNWQLVREIVKQALAEDVGAGDITTRLTVDEDQQAVGLITCRQEAVVAGLPVAQMVFEEVSPPLAFQALAEEGQTVQPNAEVARVEGHTPSILTAERTALNFLQRLSAIATLTAEYVRRANSAVRILDTRKTTPLLRILEKYAVRVGGGQNHRFGLDDGILIKDNHIIAAGAVGEAVRRAKTAAPHNLKVEVEVRNMQEAKEALTAGADALLLDNMPPQDMADIASFARDRVLLEASGGITLENVGPVSKTGVHLISIGTITHSAPAIDMTLTLTV